MNAPIRSFRKSKSGKAALELETENTVLDRLHNKYLTNPPRGVKGARVIASYVAQHDLLVELTARIKRLHQDIIKAGTKRNEIKATMGKLAKQLVECFGKGPIQIEGVTYDFGYSEDNVHLVPRRGRRAK